MAASRKRSLSQGSSGGDTSSTATTTATTTTPAATTKPATTTTPVAATKPTTASTSGTRRGRRRTTAASEAAAKKSPAFAEHCREELLIGDASCECRLCRDGAVNQSIGCATWVDRVDVALCAIDQPATRRDIARWLAQHWRAVGNTRTPEPRTITKALTRAVHHERFHLVESANAQFVLRTQASRAPLWQRNDTVERPSSIIAIALPPVIKSPPAKTTPATTTATTTATTATATTTTAMKLDIVDDDDDDESSSSPAQSADVSKDDAVVDEPSDVVSSMMLDVEPTLPDAVADNTLQQPLPLLQPLTSHLPTVTIEFVQSNVC
jgi:hypothetical protein